jgi:diaminopimelate epimerase
MKITFKKMHGLGNDFVLLDNRDDCLDLNEEKIQKIADRRFGIGCDQLIMLENPQAQQADVLMRIFNADGTEAGACGNATRCIGYLLADEFKRSDCTIETREGILFTSRLPHGRVRVDMGRPRFKWNEIPLSEECDTSSLPIKHGILENPFAVSMGNPHMVFFVTNADGVDLYHLGKELTKHQLYSEGANIEIVEILNDQTIRVRVYERGTGITTACGTGACASVVAGHHRGLLKTSVQVILEGGTLDIDYEETVKITGPVEFTFEGTFDARIFDQELRLWTQQNLQIPSKSSPWAAA